MKLKCISLFLIHIHLFQSLSFQVQAVADDKIRTSEATVVIQVQDINDNSPQFSQEV
jgi:hypothetical protein